MVNYSPLWYWVRKREAIRKQKEAGLPMPWTNDEILATYRFCNVRREDDRVTVWVRRNIRQPYSLNTRLWLMLCIARIINWPPTLEHLSSNGVAWWPNHPNFRPEHLAHGLRTWAKAGNKIYTGAYMIPAPPQKGRDKQTWIAEHMIGELWRLYRGSFRPYTLQEAHAMIREVSGWGPFLAYQAVVDMTFTDILRHAPDRRTWCAAGPGTRRGLNRLHGRGVDYNLSQAQALDEIRAIYPLVEAKTGVSIDFSDVPNILCETDKYLRVANGEGRPRALYVPGRGA